MDLSAQYLGLPLRSPLVASASPLTGSIDHLRRLEDAGAAAVVLPSLFEEDITHESDSLHQHLTQGTDSYAESLSYFPDPDELTLSPEQYLNLIARAKQALDIPVIASLNGIHLGSWTRYAQQMAQAGADALELNIYWIPTDPELPGGQVEDRYVEILAAVRETISLPVAVKLSPYFSNLAHLVARLDLAGARGLVLFNRFYQPDLDIDRLEVRPQVMLSTPFAMRLPMRWIAILYGRVRADLAATSGIHHAVDVIKMTMAGAQATMLCSALLKRGIDHLAVIEHQLREWLVEHEYESLTQMRGSLSQQHCPDPGAFERAQYLRALHGYRPGLGE